MTDRPTAAWRIKPQRRTDTTGLRSWLTDPGSLTARLQERGAFAVHLLRQGLDRPTADEIAVLGIPTRQRAHVREVALHCAGRPLVFAHTTLPRHPHGPLTGWLARLGTRSLGTLLFTHPGFTRGPLTCRRLDHRHPLYARAVTALGLDGHAPAALWARRSCFFFSEQRVLVTEIFAPELASPQSA